MRQVTFQRSAIKALSRLPANEAERIAATIEQYAAHPDSLSANVVALQGRPGYRLRVGQWRVIFEMDDRAVHVLAIGPRGSAYGRGMMSNPVFFTTPAGEEFAVLPKAEFERLAERADMASDLELYDHAKRQQGEAAGDKIPLALVRRLLAGESAVRIWREHRGLKAVELARRAGIGPAYLSQIETGAREGTVSTMAKIAIVLDVDLDDLVWPNASEPDGIP